MGQVIAKRFLEWSNAINPFDAVVILQKIGNEYTVFSANRKAEKLFGQPFQDNMKAEVFLTSCYWITIEDYIQQDVTDLKFIYMKGKEVAVSIHQKKEDFDTFVSIVIRPLREKPIVYKEEIQFAHIDVSRYDELTRLYNKKALKERWSAIEHEKKKDNIAIILADLDRFKKFNESIGKKNGDQILVAVSNKFLSFKGELCEVFRLNSDEFAFVVLYDDIEEINGLAERILNSLKEPVYVEEQEYFLSTSLGISTARTRERQLHQLLDEAEQAVVYVKHHGRSYYRYFSEDMRREFFNEALMEAHLHRAIELDELVLYFQPQVDLEKNSITSFEALIRWNNQKFGFVSPGEFIPLAESSGIILSIGDWVLERVCKYLKEWRLKGYPFVRIAVNISPSQFKQPHFAERVEELLTQYGVEPHYLEIEITESSMTDLEQTTKILRKLKDLGVYVAVDDFGTGYSSLSYLKTYPIDIIKIDQSFIADIEKDEKNEAIIETIILLSHNLGLQVVAEGVEEKKQESFLRKRNCHKVQGYLYNPPIPAELVVQEYFKSI